MDFKEAIEYLGTFSDYEKATGFAYSDAFYDLDRIKSILAGIENPHEYFKSIHIAGTKGKGSVANFIANVLKYAGFKVGLYTSPHLIDFSERIQILHLNEDITIQEEDVARLTETIKPVIDDLLQNDEFKSPTFFEVYTSLCFLYFAENEVDFAIVETGLGGRLDATNVVNPLVSVITPISLDHTKELGNTIKEIAGEKAGIIKEGVPCISSIQNPDALEIIKSTAIGKNAKLYVMGENISYKTVESDLSGGIFDCITPWNNYENIAITVLGEHQIDNASLAVACLDVLNAYHKVNIPVESVFSGLKNTYIPGRLEIMRQSPFVVIDAAHNPFSADCLKKALKSLFKWKKLNLVLGMSINKDIEGFCRNICDIADNIILTKANFIRAANPEKIKEKIKEKIETTKNIHVYQNISEAIMYAFSISSPDDLICITGSFYVVGEAKYFLEGIEKENFQTTS